MSEIFISFLIFNTFFIYFLSHVPLYVLPNFFLASSPNVGRNNSLHFINPERMRMRNSRNVFLFIVFVAKIAVFLPKCKLPFELSSFWLQPFIHIAPFHKKTSRQREVDIY